MFDIHRSTLDSFKLSIYRVLGTRDMTEAARLAAPQLEEWRELLPLEGRCQKATRPPRVLAGSLLATLKAVAAGYSAREEALALGCPKSTIEGRRSWVLKKLEATSMEQAISKALDLGVIRPEEPSVELVLHACKQLVGEAGRALRELHGLGEPTPLQLSYLELMRQGLSGPKIAKRYKVSDVAVNATLRRLWKTLGADNFKTALERIQQLDLPVSQPDSEQGAESNA
jgi:DNA-binding NarL/FixJ family response regulator